MLPVPARFRCHAQALVRVTRATFPAVLVLASLLAFLPAAWGQSPPVASQSRSGAKAAKAASARQAVTGATPKTAGSAALARIKAHEQSASANFAPVGDGLTFADPFFGGTTDSVIIESISPLVAQAPLLRRLANCTLEAGIGASSTFQVSQRIPNYEDRLHQVALLNTPFDVYPHGCTDPVTGVASQPGGVFGTDSGGNFYAVVAEPDTTTFELTNQLTVVHTQGNPISSQPALTTTITLNPNDAVTLQGDIAVGDLNGDSKLDVIVPLIDLSNGTGGTSTKNSLAILLNAGNGTLGTPTYLALNVYPVSVTIDDLNKDGKLDIIVIGAPATAGGVQGMEVFLGNGDGTFQMPIEGPSGFPSVNQFTSQLPLNSAVHVLTGDFNGDGKKDIIASTGDILFGKGDGTFTVAPTTLGIPGNAGLGLTSADFNHDGKADLAVAVYPGTINIFYGNGDGSFRPANVYTAPYGARDLTATEIDGDGNYDIVLGVCSGGLYLPDGLATLSGYFLLGRADGTFAGPLSYQPSATDVANNDTQSPDLGVFAGPLMGSGNPDLVSWESGPTGAFAVTRPFSGFSDGDLAYGAPVTSATSSTPNQSSVNFIDVDGDGKPDLVYLSGYFQEIATTLVSLHGNSDGTFGPETDTALPTTGYGYGQGSVFTSMVVANFNSDTKPDAVFFLHDSNDENSTLEFAAGAGNGQFGTPAVIDSTLITPSCIVTADVNGDGKMDLVVADAGAGNSDFEYPNPVIKVYLGKGDGTFATPLVLTMDATAPGLDDGEIGLAVADFRGNHKLDIVAGSIEVQSMNQDGEITDQGIYQVYLGNGDGTFQKQTAVTSAAGFGGPMAAVDVNRDGIPDLLIDLDSLTLYLTGNGDGTFSAPNLLEVPGSPSSFAVTDLNGDGYPDLVAMGAGISPALNVTAIPLLGNTVGTTTALTSSVSQAAPGTSITFTATVTPASGMAVPTGTVGFFDGGTELGTGTLNGSGVATYATSSLALGTHSIVATYNGDANFTISTSDTLTITIANNPVPVAGVSPTSLTFASQNLNTSSAAQSITLSNTGAAALTISSITITGTNAGDFSQTNTCGASLAASANCTISVTFKPTASGARSASVSVADNATGSPQSVSLSGTGAAAGTPTASLAPTSLTFASQNLNTSSAAQSITLTNTGNAALTISGITIGGTNAGDFSQTNTCGASLAASANCTISVTFKPTASGARTASVSVADNATGSPQTASLTGTGAAAGTPTASLAPTSLTFASQNLNTSSAAQSITLSNTGNASLTISSITITGTNAGDFSETNTCGASLAASANCTISVTFKPTASGARTASVSVADNATGSPQSASLSGTGAATGTPTASLAPTSLTFASQALNTSSAAQSITLSNTGNAALTISSITIGGTNAGDFSQTNTCGASLAASANCTISVTFKPTASGARSASVSVADNATGSPQSASLSGTGAATGTPTATLSPTSLTFPDQVITTASAAETVKLSNTSNAALTISGITFTGANAADFTETDNCGTSVAANANCTINVVFRPAASGARAAAISIADNATGSPQTASLSGNGLDITGGAAPSGFTGATVIAGETANYALQVTALGGTAADKISYTVACSGAPTNATCTAPSGTLTVSPGTPSPFVVSVTTGATIASAVPAVRFTNPPSAWRRMLYGMALVLFAIVALLGRRGRTVAAANRSRISRTLALRHAASLALLLLAAFFVASCGGSGTSKDVAPGTYQLTVTIASGADTHTVPLTLVVTK